MNTFSRLVILSLCLLLSSCASLRDQSCATNLLVSGLLFGSANCSQADGQEFVFNENIPADMASIYVYRPYSALLGSNSVEIHLNEKEPVDLDHRGYRRFLVHKGKHSIKAERIIPMDISENQTSELQLELETNTTTFVRVSFIQDGTMSIYTNGAMVEVPKYKMILGFVERDIALSELQDTKLSD